MTTAKILAVVLSFHPMIKRREQSFPGSSRRPHFLLPTGLGRKAGYEKTCGMWHQTGSYCGFAVDPTTPHLHVLHVADFTVPAGLCHYFNDTRANKRPGMGSAAFRLTENQRNKPLMCALSFVNSAIFAANDHSCAELSPGTNTTRVQFSVKPSGPPTMNLMLF
jgi:hypothetical protein